tara:strand:+ start:369 stop:506 length:138 start_codon:yes stop_codon:yes gene_type:complete
METPFCCSFPRARTSWWMLGVPEDRAKEINGSPGAKYYRRYSGEG